MSTLVNVVQSSRDMEMGRMSSGVGYHDTRVVRKRRKSEEKCMNNCKLCFCLVFTFASGVYLIAVVVILITENQRWSEIGDGSG